MKELLNALFTDEVRRCELCGSDSWRVLHEGDESNCECEGECLRVCDNPDLSDDGCDGVAELVNQDQGECDKCDAFYDLGSQDNRCGNCGNCGNCCKHKGDKDE
jgi:hypothetical protein